MQQSHTALGMSARLNTGFEAALARTVAALRAEGFGVLTEIDVRETLRNKLDVEFRTYKILGACNPPLAHRALLTAPEVGLLLPCNVTVAYLEENVTKVSLVNPLSMLGMVNHPELEPIAEEARQRLDRVIASLRTLP